MLSKAFDAEAAQRLTDGLDEKIADVWSCSVEEITVFDISAVKSFRSVSAYLGYGSQRPESER